MCLTEFMSTCAGRKEELNVVAEIWFGKKLKCKVIEEEEKF